MSKIDLEDLLKGRLSVWCQNTTEVLFLCELLRSRGVDVRRTDKLDKASIRVDPSRNSPHTEYSRFGPSWQARNGFVQRWIYFADFMASCGLSDPQISITTLEGLV